MEQQKTTTPPRESYLLETVRPKSIYILTQDDWDALELAGFTWDEISDEFHRLDREEGMPFTGASWRQILAEQQPHTWIIKIGRSRWHMKGIPEFAFGFSVAVFFFFLPEILGFACTSGVGP